MKAFFISGSIIFTVLILILAFENMGAQVNGFQFLFTAFDSPFFIVLGIAFIGVITGAFYTGLVLRLAKGDDEEAGGNEW